MSQKLVAVLGMLLLAPLATPFAAAQTVPSGTDMLLRVDTPLSTRMNRPGDPFTATVLEPRSFEGAIVHGHVRDIDESGRLRGRTQMSLGFDSIEFRGRNIRPFRAQLQDVRESETVKIVDQEGRIMCGNRSSQTLKRSGIGAAVGGVLGGAHGRGEHAETGPCKWATADHRSNHSG